MSSDLVIVWRVTEKCNLACPFCAYDRTIVRPRSAADPNQVLRFGEVLHNSGRDVLVSWLGGEPFLWQPLLEVSHAFKHQFGLRVAVTTSGLALKAERIREHLVNDFDQVTISIDAIGREHDRLRGASGLFDHLRANLQALSRLRARQSAALLIRVNTVLMHTNLHTFEALCVQLADWGVTEVTFNSIGGRDRPEFFPVHRLTVEDAAWLRAELPGIRARMSVLGLAIQGSDMYLERILQLAQAETYFVEDCAPGQQFIFVDERGLAAPCHFTVDDYGILIDSLRAPSDLVSLPAIFSDRKRHHASAACRNCLSTQVFGKYERFHAGESYESRRTPFGNPGAEAG